MHDDVGNILSEIQKLKSSQAKTGTGPSVFYVGVMVGLFTEKHMKRMGQAIYTYGLLLSKVTGWDKRCSLGAVLKGAPLKLERLSKESGIHPRTIRRHVKSLEEHGYVITLRSPRGLKFYITNYRPAGKPRLKSGECPDLAVQQLTNLSAHPPVSGQHVATHEGYKRMGIKTEAADLNQNKKDLLQPFAEIYLILDQLFGVKPGTAEIRYLFRGNKHTSTFHDTPTVLKAIARTLMADQTKRTDQEKKGMKPVGITNVMAYLNSGLHGRNRYLLRARQDEHAVIAKINALYESLREQCEKARAEKITDHSQQIERS